MAAIDVLAAWFGRNTERWARQAIATLNANGYSVVRLPNPDAKTGDWFGKDWGVMVADARVEIHTTEYQLRATDAQQLAAALLAAAHALGATE
jgi:predicted CoA-binding protein